jgi:hypothetical protein
MYPEKYESNSFISLSTGIIKLDNELIEEQVELKHLLVGAGNGQVLIFHCAHCSSDTLGETEPPILITAVCVNLN